MYTKRLSNPRAWGAAALVFVLAACAGNALADPPDRVARISFLRGDVSFQPSGDDQWAEASLNRPLGTGDKVYTDKDSRAELEIGAANIRLDESSTFTLSNLDDTTAQVELTDGVMNLHVRGVGEGQSIEIDTPTLAFVVNRAGNYRIDIAPEGGSTMITVFDGAGDVYGENNASYNVRAGNSYRFNDSALHDYEVLDLPRADDFDRWCDSRNTRYSHSVASSYVAEDMIGYADLDDNGAWNDEPEYGHVWYPTTVATDWAPYRSGHWSWIDPWGWTWVDTAAWGFAPFHYGRWAYIGNRWGWCPGERRRWGSVYAPAMVGFVGGNGWGVSVGGGGPVGWFPLGPRDVYVPWYHASRDYFTNINVRNSHGITNVNITNIYNNYSAGRPITNVAYAYRSNERAVTAVSRETFVGSRAVAGARIQVNDNQLRNAQVVSRMAIAPTQASFVAGTAGRARVAPPTAALDRRVIARTAPPAAALPIASRLQAIQRNGAQPLAANELRSMPASRTAAATQGRQTATRVQVVGHATTQPQALPMRGAAAARTEAADHAVPARGMPNNGARTPINVPNSNVPRDQAVRTSPQAADHAQSGAPDRHSALPSSRFAPGRNGAADAAVSQDRGNSPVIRGGAQPQSHTQAMPRTDLQSRQRSDNAVRSEPADHVVQPRTPQSQVREAPQREMRQVPQQQQQQQVREAPQREMRQVQQPQVREMPQREMRQAPQPQQQVREAPQREVRQAPQPQQQQQVREAPQREMRQAPPPQQQAQPRAQPQPRPQPADREKKKDDDDNKGRR